MVKVPDARAELREQAWAVVARCAREGALVAAADSSLYPHVWTRDVGVAALGIVAAARGEEDVASLVRSLELVVAALDPRGRAPLKVDPRTGREVPENSAGVDGGLWLVIAVDAIGRRFPGRVDHLVAPALLALAWTEHLDLTGAGLLVSPEASDWADMLPHRHHVLALNVLYAAALEAAARLDDGRAEALRARAADTRRRIELRFAVEARTSPEAASEAVRALGAESHEWGLTGQYATRYGELPFYLPYVDFRAVGRHLDVVGNLLAVLTGVADAGRARGILGYLEDVGAAEPWPTAAIYPPILPGDPDWRDYFHWRNLNLPHHYQNGGAWPFIGALHVAAEVHAGRHDRAAALLERLAAACLDGRFPEWHHGITGRPMGEAAQLWSATGALYALEAVEHGAAPLLPPT